MPLWPQFDFIEKIFFQCFIVAAYFFGGMVMCPLTDTYVSRQLLCWDGDDAGGARAGLATSRCWDTAVMGRNFLLSRLR